jgi:hypothetical protein
MLTRSMLVLDLFVPKRTVTRGELTITVLHAVGNVICCSFGYKSVLDRHIQSIHVNRKLDTYGAKPVDNEGLADSLLGYDSCSDAFADYSKWDSISGICVAE